MWLTMDRYARIRNRLNKTFDINHIELENESYKHAGHAGDDGTGETHYKLLLVSNDFVGLSRVERYRKVHSVIQPEMVLGLHAISLTLMTEHEYCNKVE